MNFTLLIQGPIVSGGLSGRTWGKGKTKAPKENFFRFDSSGTVMRNIENGKKFFNHVVLSTWSDEDTSFLDSAKKEILLLKNPDPGNVDGFVRRPIEGIKHTHENNATRQFQGILFGLAAAESLGSTHVVKIRTDQEVNLQRLREEVEAHFTTLRDTVLVPFIDLNVPWSIPDFYIAFEMKHGLKVAEIMSNRPRFNNNVHIDFFLKNMLIARPQLILSNFHELFFHGAPSLSFEKTIRPIVLEMFRPGTRELFLETSWRGEKIIHQSSNFLFSGDARLNEMARYSSDRKRMRDTKQAIRFLTLNHSFVSFFVSIVKESIVNLNSRRYGLSSLKRFLHQQMLKLKRKPLG